jgi:hypothetical protein
VLLTTTIYLSSFFQDRLELMSRSHVTEVAQKTRLELENGQVSKEELDKSIQVRIMLHLKACLYQIVFGTWTNAYNNYLPYRAFDFFRIDWNECMVAPTLFCGRGGNG